jgi:sarcosine oxidase subunit gamma
MARPDQDSEVHLNAAPRRSFVHRDLEAQGANFRVVDDCRLAANFGLADEEEQASALGLVDLSPLPRIGFKGSKVGSWLASQGCRIPEESNRAGLDRDGILAARLAPGEALLLSGTDGSGERIGALERAWSYEVGGIWPVPRRDGTFWFMVVGRHAPAMFAKICGVDLREKWFPRGAIAQTSVARTNTIVIRASSDVPAYHLLGDSASAAFMHTSIQDAMVEFEGALVGFDALQAIVA